MYDTSCWNHGHRPGVLKYAVQTAAAAGLDSSRYEQFPGDALTLDWGLNQYDAVLMANHLQVSF